MKVYFISDDSFFLLGASAVIAPNIAGISSFININESFEAPVPKHQDIVVVAVKDIRQRARVMAASSLQGSKLLLVVDEPASNITGVFYPWVLQKNCSKREFIGFINKAVRHNGYMDKSSSKIKKVFLNLSMGAKMDELAEKLNLPESHLYQVKRNVIRRYGLYNCNVAGVLICRDILQLTVLRE